MSGTPTLREKQVQVETQDENAGSLQKAVEGPDDQLERAASMVENHKPTTPSGEEDKQPAAVPAKNQQSEEMIENLVDLFRDFLQAAPNRAVSTSPSVMQRKTAGCKRFFGLAKGSSPETESSDKYDYEQKYPRDGLGEEAAENARIWLTYLDEAESFDRERVEGWKETVDVLLVFAGLFSGVITTFVSQASQSLQQDNSRVTASLLFEVTQLLRANFNEMPVNRVPSSTVTPTSIFTPSTNVSLVNGLWFTSLAITLSTALFAVLAKQWLYYYLSSISGTANEKARARRLRFNGFELWKVAAIVDLLPILLHLALGMFLTGIVILLFPLNNYIAWTITLITGITYTLYFISVILPIWYPECPYTTSLTIYVGIIFFVLRRVLQRIGAKLNYGFRAIWRRINYSSRCTIELLVHCIQGLVRYAIIKLAGVMNLGFSILLLVVSDDEKLPKFTEWREENIKQAVRNATFLDFEAFNWLYTTSPNRSVHRIIARCAAVHPTIAERLEWGNSRNLCHTLGVSGMNVVDLRYSLCLALTASELSPWVLFKTIPDLEERQLEEGEYQSYLRISGYVFNRNRVEILHDAINDNLNLPLTMWCHFLMKMSPDTMVATHILIHGTNSLFRWVLDPTRDLIRNGGLVRFDDRELGWWKFRYLFHHFRVYNRVGYPSDANSENKHYLLLITIYRHLTSDRPLITNKEQRQKSLENLFDNFWWHVYSSNRFRTLCNALVFFKEVCCVDSFWCESMTDRARRKAVWSLRFMDVSINNHTANLALFMDGHDLSLIYQWYSRDLRSRLLQATPPLLALLLIPQNRHHLSTILLNDPDAVSHILICLNNLAKYDNIDTENYVYSVLMDLLESVNRKTPLFTILYDSAVLVQFWKLLVSRNWDTKRYFLLVKSKLERGKLDELFATMNELVRSGDLSNLHPISTWLRAGRDTDEDTDEDTDGVRDTFQASAHRFGQLIGVFPTQLEVSTHQSAPVNTALDKNYDIEGRSEFPGVDERKALHTIASWTKTAFNSVWTTTSIKQNNNRELGMYR